MQAPWTGTWADVLFGVPLEIAIIIVVGLIARFVTHRVIDRIALGIASGAGGLARLEDLRPNSTARITSTTLTERSERRARTTASVLKSLTTALLATVVTIMVLDVLSIPVAPLLASAGIVGVAVGFGAQSLVKDVISGLFMIVEDQYGVGDTVDVGSGVSPTNGVSGVVEAVGLRVTRLRAGDGTVWYVRNGEILRVGNSSQGWARALLDIGIADGRQLDRAEAVMLDCAEDLRRDDHFAARIIDAPQVLGVEAASADGVVIRLVVKTEPTAQWDVARELRRRVLERLAAENIELSAAPAPS